jgi:FkbM family methyltransferase
VLSAVTGLPIVIMRLWDIFKIWVLRSLGKLRRWAIGPYGIAVLSRTENGLLLAPAGDLMVGRRLSFNGRYDPDLLELLLKRCAATSQVLFVGAHVGALAVPVAKKVQRVAAIEANPTTLELLRMNIVLNGLQNVEVHGFAAGDREGEVSFLAGQLNSGGSGLEIGERSRWAYVYDKPESITVQMKSLDDVFPDACFDLIVMDIEGAEALALRGMGNLLKRSRALLVEVFEDHLRRVAKVSNDEFLALVAPFYDEAVILPEKPSWGEPVSSAPYPRSAFPKMMLDCCRLRMANVMFWRERTTVSVDSITPPEGMKTAELATEK